MNWQTAIVLVVALLVAGALVWTGHDKAGALASMVASLVLSMMGRLFPPNPAKGDQ